MCMIYIDVWGEYACFSRPEFSVERVSYDTITPSAARGILQAIYWKPQMDWQIKEIHVINHINFISIKRNELGCRHRLNNYILINEQRQQRTSLILKDVRYIIGADILAHDNELAKHKSIAIRRASKGQCYYSPYLGCREFIANFILKDKPTIKSSITGQVDLGWMFYDYDYKNNIEPRFFRATMNNGTILIPSNEEIFIK